MFLLRFFVQISRHLPIIILISLIIFILLGKYSYTVLYNIGLVSQQVSVAGTGSMYPTFPKGQSSSPTEQAQEIVANPLMDAYPGGITLFGKRYFGKTLERGDIVEFRNAKTDEITSKIYGDASGLIKRVIALPGDIIEIKDGVVFLNDVAQKEKYTAKPHSTFGGNFLPDCQSLEIPENKVFVMGDNRKGSGDSRQEVGLIDMADIHYVLPNKKQLGEWDKNWRNTDEDLNPSTKIKLETNTFVELVNKERAKLDIKPLKIDTRLSNSAKLRGDNILKYDDLSYQATRSGYTMDKSMADAGYYNVIRGEAFTLGYYESEELVEGLFELPKWKDFLLSKDFQDIGIAEVGGELNGCPAQIIVQQFGGYIPPNYTESDIQGWQDQLNQLRGIQGSWNELKGERYNDFYQAHKSDVDRINEIITVRINTTSIILNKLKSNQWLTGEEKNLMTQDEQLAAEQDVIASRLNSN